MVFLIEGIDGCGKSTLVDGLKKVLPDISYIKESYPGDSVEERCERVGRLRQAILGGKTVVYDRATAIDEFCYEPVIGKRNPTLSWEHVKPILEHCTIIYLRCDMSVIKERLAARGDEYVTEDMLESINANYEERLSQLHSVWTLDVTNLDKTEVRDAVVDLIVSTAGKNTCAKKHRKLAHIVPRELLYTIADNQYQMSLAHLIKQDEEYLNFYRRMVAAGRYVLMDNGAAENSQLGLDDLYECWFRLRPTELILPDTLCDRESTLQKTKEAIQYFRRRGVTSYFMAVPQGKDLEDWKRCAEELVKLPEVHCLGVSKFLTIETGNPDVRYEAVEFIKQLREQCGRNDIEVHLLGCDAGPSEPEKIFRDFDFVRGCDTALAYIYAQAGVKLTANSKRPEGEMSFLENTLDSVTDLTDAMKKFDDISGVVNNFGDYTWK